jgi:hypothetical protein
MMSAVYNSMRRLGVDCQQQSSILADSGAMFAIGSA